MMAEVKSIACDMCGKPGVSTYSITVVPGGHPWLIDLCETHAKPILRMQEKGRSPSSRRKYRRFGEKVAVAPVRKSKNAPVQAEKAPQRRQKAD